jgi:hypothetical protein
VYHARVPSCRLRQQEMRQEMNFEGMLRHAEPKVRI